MHWLLCCCYCIIMLLHYCYVCCMMLLCFVCCIPSTRKNGYANCWDGKLSINQSKLCTLRMYRTVYIHCYFMAVRISVMCKQSIPVSNNANIRVYTEYKIVLSCQPFLNKTGHLQKLTKYLTPFQPHLLNIHTCVTGLRKPG